MRAVLCYAVQCSAVQCGDGACAGAVTDAWTAWQREWGYTFSMLQAVHTRHRVVWAGAPGWRRVAGMRQILQSLMEQPGFYRPGSTLAVVPPVSQQQLWNKLVPAKLQSASQPPPQIFCLVEFAALSFALCAAVFPLSAPTVDHLCCAVAMLRDKSQELPSSLQPQWLLNRGAAAAAGSDAAGTGAPKQSSAAPSASPAAGREGKWVADRWGATEKDPDSKWGHDPYDRPRWGEERPDGDERGLGGGRMPRDTGRCALHALIKQLDV